jgi:acyl-CoA thioesterase
MEPVTHPFDQAIALQALPDGSLAGHTSERYWNLVNPYGGVTAATILNSVLTQPGRIGDPLVLTVNFAGAMQPGPFEISTRLARANRSTQYWTMQLTQPGDAQVLVSAMAVVAKRRKTWALAEAAPPAALEPEAVASLPDLPGRSWSSLYEMRYARGRILQENDDSVSHTWVRDVPRRALDYASLTSICDIFVPRLFLRRATLVGVATVSMNVYFHVDAAGLAQQGDKHVMCVARANVFTQGFCDQEGQVWSREGRLLATTQQVMWFKA